MKHVVPAPDWRESWRYSYIYDRMELYGDASNFGYSYAYAVRRTQTLQMVSEVVPKGGRVLDIAGAQGNFSLSLAEAGYRVTWNDLRADLEGYMRLKYEFGDVTYASGNAFEITFPEPFDCVLVTEIIEHVAHPDVFLRKVASLVRPGGYVVLTTPNGGYFMNSLPRFSDCLDPTVFEAVQFKPNSDGHIFLLWPDEVAALAQAAGLVVEEHSLFTTPLTNGHCGLGPLLWFLPKKLVMAIERAAALLPFRIKRRLLVHSATRMRRPA